MAAIIDALCKDEAGEYDAYALADRSYVFLAGNLRDWPQGLRASAELIDLSLGDGSDGHGRDAVHRLRALDLPGGEHLVVGRNLTELTKIRDLMGQALLRTLALSLVLGVSGGLLFSRLLSRRLERINAGSLAILRGEWASRIPETGSGDELDRLAHNLNRMLDRIEDLVRGMREVTGNIAHDLRRPISRLRSRIEVALMDEADVASYRETLEQTIEDADQVLELFNSLLTIAEAESGEATDRFEPIDLASIARSTVEIYEPLAEEAGRSIELSGESSLPWSGEPNLIAQALANLLDNAIKHAPGKGTIEVAAVLDNGDALLIVGDGGPGIPAEFRERALERFTRLDESRTTSGHGLGLSLVHAVARLHRGSISLQDNQPGLRVVLRLPAR